MTDTTRYAADLASARANLDRVIARAGLSLAHRDAILRHVGEAIVASYMEGVAGMREAQIANAVRAPLDRAADACSEAGLYEIAEEVRYLRLNDRKRLHAIREGVAAVDGSARIANAVAALDAALAGEEGDR